MRDRFLAWLARGVTTRPGTIIATAVLLTIVAAALIPGLRVEAGHSSMVDANSPHQRRFNAFLKRFGSPNVLFVIVRGGDADLRHRVIDGLASRLPAPAGAKRGATAAACDKAGGPKHPGCVRSVLGRVDIEALQRYGLLYAPLPALKKLVKQLRDDKLGLRRLLSLRGLGDLIRLAADEVERRGQGAAPTGEAAKQAKMAMSLAAKVIDEIRRRVEDAARARVPVERALAPPGTLDRVRQGVDGAGYFASRDGKLALAMIRPINDSDEPDVVVPFVHYVQRHARAVLAAAAKHCSRAGKANRCAGANTLQLTLTGLPALVADEADALARDVPLTSAVAGVGILLLFIFAFRSVRQGVLSVVMLGCSLLCTLALARFVVGGLNLITTAAIPTILGLGIDFSVHLFARYNEARHGGADARGAVERALMGAGPGILTGALTTAGAFVALMINRFKGFSDLGIITGIGLMLALVATMTVIAAALSWAKVPFLHVPPKQRKPGDSARDSRLGALLQRHRWVIVTLGLAVTALMLWQSRRTPWSYNYMALLPEGKDAVAGIVTLSRRTDFSSEVAALEASSLAEAAAFKRALQKLPTVGRIESIISFLPTNQDKKRALLAKLSPLITKPAWQTTRTPTSQPSSQPASKPSSQPASKPSPRPAPRRFDIARFDRALEALKDNLEDARFAAKRAKQNAQAKLLEGPIAALDKLRKAIAKDRARAARHLAIFERELLRKADRGYELLLANVRGPRVDAKALLANLPRGIRERLVAEGRYALYVHPKSSVWDGNMLERFVADVRTVQKSATGFTVFHWEANVLITTGFRDASILAVIVLLVLLLVDFRNLTYTLLAATPLALGVAWMLGGMALLGVSYNFANVIAFPLIVGIGVASAVHILHRYRQDGERDIAPAVRHTGMAVFLSAATTMVGFGSVALSSHRGAASLGLLLLLGVGACLVTSTVLLPALLAVRQNRRARTAKRDD